MNNIFNTNISNNKSFISCILQTDLFIANWLICFVSPPNKFRVTKSKECSSWNILKRVEMGQGLFW